jgi:hypothetical protein
MKFETFATMRSNPDFELNAFLEPFEFNAEASGSFAGKVGLIDAHVGKIPINMAIPFDPRRRLVTVASIGGFRLKLEPMQVSVDRVAVHAGGVLGAKGMQGKLKGRVGCATEMKAEGKLSGKMSNIEIRIDDDESKNSSHTTDETVGHTDKT